MDKPIHWTLLFSEKTKKVCKLNKHKIKAIIKALPYNTKWMTCWVMWLGLPLAPRACCSAFWSRLSQDLRLRTVGVPTGNVFGATASLPAKKHAHSVVRILPLFGWKKVKLESQLPPVAPAGDPPPLTAGTPASVSERKDNFTIHNNRSFTQQGYVFPCKCRFLRNGKTGCALYRHHESFTWRSKDGDIRWSLRGTSPTAAARRKRSGVGKVRSWWNRWGSLRRHRWVRHVGCVGRQISTDTVARGRLGYRLRNAMFQVTATSHLFRHGNQR